MRPYCLVCKYVEGSENVSNIDLKSPIHSDAMSLTVLIGFILCAHGFILCANS